MLSILCTLSGSPGSTNMPGSGSLIRSRSTVLASSTHSRSLPVFWVDYYPHVISRSTPQFLDKAVDLADQVMPIFETPSGIPTSFIDLKESVGQVDKDNKGWSSLSQVATVQLELKYLSHLTDDYTYWRAAE